MNHSACEEAGEKACVCWTRAGHWGLPRSPQALPAMGIDISVGCVVLYLGLKGHCISICILLLCIEDSYAIEDCLNMGTPDGLGTHSQLMPRVLARLLLVPPAAAAPSSP